jgi:hypothetical protein
MTPNIEPASPQSSEGRKNLGMGVGAYVLALIIAIVGAMLLAFGQLPAVILLIIAGGIALLAHRNLRKARLTMR